MAWLYPGADCVRCSGNLVLKSDTRWTEPGSGTVASNLERRKSAVPEQVPGDPSGRAAVFGVSPSSRSGKKNLLQAENSDGNPPLWAQRSYGGRRSFERAKSWRRCIQKQQISGNISGRARRIRNTRQRLGYSVYFTDPPRIQPAPFINCTRGTLRVPRFPGGQLFLDTMRDFRCSAPPWAKASRSHERHSNKARRGGRLAGTQPARA